ncbi:MAG: photosynthetic reaction center cytochrome c subunit family protein [Pseudomonadota bacterium]
MQIRSLMEFSRRIGGLSGKRPFAAIIPVSAVAGTILFAVNLISFEQPLEGSRLQTAQVDTLDVLEFERYAVRTTMKRAIKGLGEKIDGHLNANGGVGATCLSCHQGQGVASEISNLLPPSTESAVGWRSRQSQGTLRSLSASLPTGTLERYLSDGQEAWLHGYEFLTPAEANNKHIVPASSLLPKERIELRNGNASSVTCNSCHNGHQQTLQRMNEIGDWPPLRSTEEVVEL